MLLKRVAIVAVALAASAAFGCRTAEPPAASGASDGGGADGAADAEPPYVESPLLPATQWKPVPGLPHSCPDRVAIDPKSAVPPLSWKACASGKAGCERADVDWSPQRYGGVYFVDPEPIRRINGTVRISYVRKEWATYAGYIRRISVVADGSGAAVFAVGDVPDPGGHTCTKGRYAGSRGIVIDAIPPVGDSQYMILSSWARPSELVVHTLPRDAFSPLEPPYVSAWGSSGTVFFYTNAPPSTALYDVDRRVVTLAKSGAARLDALAYVGLDDGALTIPTSGGARRVGFIDPSGTHESLFDVPPMHSVSAIAVDRGASAPQMVWIEAGADNGDFTSTEIWTSPASKTAAGVKRRLVAKDPYGSGFSLAALVADRGLAFFKNGLQSSRLVRLSDGRGWVIPADADHNVSEIMGITDDSVWLLVSKRDPLVQDVTWATGIQRVRLDSLGEPTVASGL